MSANDIVMKVCSALQRAKIPFMVVGSFSSNVYGIERSTQDADFVLELESGNISNVIRELCPEFKVDSQMGFETVTMTSRCIASHQDPFFKIELFLLSDDSHDKSRFQRRVENLAAGIKIYYPRPEDVIVTKLRWSKGGRRRKDVDDVANILAVQQGRLDLAYIREWTGKHETTELFEKLLAETPKV